MKGWFKSKFGRTDSRSSSNFDQNMAYKSKLDVDDDPYGTADRTKSVAIDEVNKVVYKE